MFSMRLSVRADFDFLLIYLRQLRWLMQLLGVNAMVARRLGFDSIKTAVSSS